MSAPPPAGGPLEGILVVDLSRMLPGAVLSKMLLELGARVIKIEEPVRGDPLRSARPLVDGIGAAFRAFLQGAESVGLDLRLAAHASALRKLARHADVMIESFRPGRLESWDLGPDRLAGINPALILCSLSGFGVAGPEATRVGHDLNFTAASGILSLLPGDGVPRVQIADVGTGLLACSAVLGALLARVRTGRGRWIDQPLVGGPAPFLILPAAEAAAGGGGVGQTLLGGACPSYRRYRCGDGRELAVCALEPKFWDGLLEMLELPGLAGLGLDTGKAGHEASRRVTERLATRPRDEWLALARERNLPVSAVRDLHPSTEGDARGSVREAPSGTAPLLPSLGTPPGRPAPHLGEHTAKVAAEFSLDLAG